MPSRLARLAGEIAEAWEVPRDLLLGRYPSFVAGGPLRRDEIPVFVFHDAEPVGFQRKLRHLADNGYETLSLDEYLSVVRGEREPRERAVLLTFDDGRASVATVAAPLLRRFAMRAVVFLVPGRMHAGSTAEPVARQSALLGWADVDSLAAGGLLEFQSHTLHHARIHVEPRITGFATPGSGLGYLAFDQPLVREDARDLLGTQVPLGTPLLRSAARTSEALRFFEDQAPRRACAELVAQNGGAEFFLRPDWERRLRRAAGRAPLGGVLETPAERAQAIAQELRESRRLIEAHTGRPVVHLCYPWHTAGPTARRLAAEAGYQTAFCGKVPGVPITRPGGDLASIARLGEDYVELLPGSGRATLGEVLRRKWRRRFGARRDSGPSSQ